MNYFLLASFCVMSILAQGQDTGNNFHLEQQNIVWQERLDSASVSPDYMVKLKAKNILENLQEQQGQFIGDLRETVILHKEAGYSFMVTPVIMLNHHVKGTATVEKKGHGYLITVRKIMLVKPTGKDEQGRPLEKDETRNGRFKMLFMRDNSKILSVTFEKLFWVDD